MIIAFFQKIALIVMSFLTCFVYKFEVVGKENLKNIKPPLIIVANHKSFCDHFFLGAAITPAFQFNSPFPPLKFLTADSLFKTFVGPFVFLLGGFPALRGQGLDASLKKPLKILKNNGTLVFYPEGVRIKEPDKIGEPKKGIGALALWSNERIIPVAIKGTSDRKNGIKIIIGQPFFIRDCFNPQDPKGTEQDFTEASRIIMNKVKELYFSA